jgi:hypothetical protein
MVLAEVFAALGAVPGIDKAARRLIFDRSADQDFQDIHPDTMV